MSDEIILGQAINRAAAIQEARIAAINRFIGDTAIGIYRDQLVGKLEGKPDLDELRRCAAASRLAAQVFAETFGMVEVKEKPAPPPSPAA